LPDSLESDKTQLNSPSSESAVYRGRVVTRYGDTSVVEDADGSLHRCSTRRRLPHIACGDFVTWKQALHGTNVISAIEPRRNELVRRVRYGPARVIAANIDQLAVVTACLPASNWEMVDQLLVTARALRCEAIVVANKSDLACNREVFHAASLEYRKIGYLLIETSAVKAHGADALEAQLRAKTTIMVGHSGVGKSSLIKLLLPHKDIRIGELSEASGLGKHTTSNSTLYRLPQGGELIDSPGIRDFHPESLSPHQLIRGYCEFIPYLGHCRFHNCSHTVEPGCALIKATERGEISTRRLTSYQHLARKLVANQTA
jgi:ribosome biogenesis GTPase